MSENVFEKNLSTLISSDAIHRRIREMGEEISRDFEGKEINVIGTLKGCFLFMADLVRHITPLADRHVIIVEDIIDTGITLNFLIEHVHLRKPASVKIASLLVKEEKQQMKYPIDYRGFNIDDYFVVGYGMDFQGYFRNLDYVAIMDDDPQLDLFPVGGKQSS